ncbi:MAG: hypothetical protein ACREON_16490 [Gemmatimonadaceae bacterium]
MTDSNPSGPRSTGRTGTMVGILVTVLLMLVLYFYWRTTGVRDEEGRRPLPAAAESLPPG